MHLKLDKIKTVKQVQAYNFKLKGILLNHLTMFSTNSWSHLTLWILPLSHVKNNKHQILWTVSVTKLGLKISLKPLLSGSISKVILNLWATKVALSVTRKCVYIDLVFSLRTGNNSIPETMFVLVTWNSVQSPYCKWFQMWQCHQQYPTELNNRWNFDNSEGFHIS